jgi:hypothetical protein
MLDTTVRHHGSNTLQICAILNDLHLLEECGRQIKAGRPQRTPQHPHPPLHQHPAPGPRRPCHRTKGQGPMNDDDFCPILAHHFPGAVHPPSYGFPTDDPKHHCLFSHLHPSISWGPKMMSMSATSTSLSPTAPKNREPGIEHYAQTTHPGPVGPNHKEPALCSRPPPWKLAHQGPLPGNAQQPRWACYLVIQTTFYFSTLGHVLEAPGGRRRPPPELEQHSPCGYAAVGVRALIAQDAGVSHFTLLRPHVCAPNNSLTERQTSPTEGRPPQQSRDGTSHTTQYLSGVAPRTLHYGTPPRLPSWPPRLWTDPRPPSPLPQHPQIHTIQKYTHHTEIRKRTYTKPINERKQHKNKQNKINKK